MPGANVPFRARSLQGNAIVRRWALGDSRRFVIFQPRLARGTLLRRYKRFLADIETGSGARRKRMTIHCANTGAMTGCAEPGSPVWYSTSTNPRRKYAHTLELVRDFDGDLIGVNTGCANGLVAEAVAAGLLPGLPAPPPEPSPTVGSGRAFLQREVDIGEAVTGERGRFDLRVGDSFVEVKTVTLKVANGAAGEGAFPDAVSARATRHVAALAAAARGGRNAALVFCVLHTGIRFVRPADEIDPTYGAALRAAAASGVKVCALGCRISPRGIAPCGLLPVEL